ncbi:hypothetical protein B4135_1410 [Caldibacillus debilis]|uniref:Uncharacterized protein n=1 Tax=Caldibacillus debilis TaxID=301148 RepID=A0A150MCM7_9BACI|nr:hypothetical protein B4135_1410 [Caldibacillus debilis]
MIRFQSAVRFPDRFRLSTGAVWGDIKRGLLRTTNQFTDQNG